MPLTVDKHKPEFDESLPDWELVADCDKGERAVKSKGAKYLPRPNPDDTTPENRARYESYKQRAQYINYTRSTLNGLVGEVFSENVRIELPANIESLEENIDGVGVRLEQQARRTLRNVLRAGRAALFVDYPRTSGEVKKTDKMLPTIVSYAPSAIINWQSQMLGGSRKLSLLTIEESSREQDSGDPFTEVVIPQWRVLRLVDGVYVVEIYRKDNDSESKDDFILVDQYMPSMGNGSTWNEIPFQFVGSTNNDEDIDCSPLYDIASLNIGHYRNSADYEESVFTVGQPMYHLSGLTQGWIEQQFPDGLHVGSRRVAMLPAGGGAGILQPNPNLLASEAMLKKQDQIVSLGGRIIQQTDVGKTATEVTTENGKQLSVLGIAANNVSQAYVKALGWANLYASANTDSAKIAFELNTDFNIVSQDPQALDALVRSWHAGAITDEEMRNDLHKRKVATADFDEWKDNYDSKPVGIDAIKGGEI